MNINPSIQKHFVNRDRELKLFQQIVAGQNPKHIVTIRADGGEGKSWLLARLIHECSCQKIKFVEHDFRTNKAKDFLSILQHARDSGEMAGYFESFTKLAIKLQKKLPTLFDESNTPSANQIDINDINESDITAAGRDIYQIQIRDSFNGLPENPTAEMQERLTHQFIECFNLYMKNDVQVWFFDHFEQASNSVTKWLLDEFLCPIRDGQIENMIFVIAGRSVLQLGLEWDHVASSIELGKFSIQDFENYAQKNKVDINREAIELLYRAHKGNIQTFALDIKLRQEETSL